MNIMILCNGQAPPRPLFTEIFQWADLFIAADGGGNTARSLGTLPDYVIGDLDSFESQKDENIDLLHKPDQNSNDLEKALQFACDQGGTHIRVLGATGRRLDHTLKNLSVLKQFNNQFQKLLFMDAYGKIQLLPRNFSREIPPETTVSLFPLSGKVTGIITEGLQFPLDDEVLENGIRDGSSNKVVATPVSITYKEGDLLLFIAK